MRIETLSGPHVVVELAGELDVTNAADLRRRLRTLADATDVQVVDLDLLQVTLMDSTALGVLFGATCRFGAKGCVLRVTAASLVVEQVLRATGLHARLCTHGGNDAKASRKALRPNTVDL